VAAVATFAPPDGSKLFGMVTAKGFTFTNTNWTITLEGSCGNEHASVPGRQ
jgi:hypothetical protein